MKLFIISFVILIIASVQSQEIEENTNLGYYNSDSAKSFIDNLLASYTVGSECYSSSCPQTFLFSPMNTFRCPKAGKKYGAIGRESKQGLYYIWFSTFVPFHWHGQFYATFDEKNVVKNRQGGYEIQIDLEVGYKMIIIPCNQGGLHSQHCNSRKKDHQLQIFKTFPQADALFQYCTFTMTRH